MTALADHAHAHLVGGRHERTGTPEPDAAGELGGVDVQGVGSVHTPAGRLEQALAEHDVGAAGPLLPRLEHEDDVAGEVVPQAVQDAGGAHEGGDVQVVAARVHEPLVGRCVVEAELLSDRQAVHVAAEQHHLPLPPVGRLGLATQHRDHRRELLAHGDLEVEPVERVQDQALGDRQLVAELGHPVQPSPQGDQVVGDGLGSRESAHPRNASTAPR